MKTILWFVLSSLLFPNVWGCTVPPPSIECGNKGCKMYNYQGVWDNRFHCTASAAYYPKSEAEVLNIVAEAVKTNRTVNVISNLAHSLTPLACVGDGGAIISTRDLSSFSYVDHHAQTISVDPGMHMRDVFGEAAKDGLTLYNAPFWDGVTAAGCISTGAHGSGLHNKGSGVYEYVAALRLVVPTDSSHGYTKVIELTESDEDMNAARLSLGTLGVITRVTFKLEPMFKRTFSISVVGDDKFEDNFDGFLRESEFAIIVWLIGDGMAALVTSRKVSVNTSGDADTAASFSPAVSVQSLEDNATAYERTLATGDVKSLCLVNTSAASTPTPQPVEMVGYNNKMATGGGCQTYHQLADTDPDCLPHKIHDKNETVCSWDRRVHVFTTFDVEIRVPMSRARDAIIDLKRLREVSPPGALCQLLSTGLIMRTIKESKAYLGPPEDMVTFEFNQYHPRVPFTPSLNIDVFQEMEQILVGKHGGHVHWGKSGGYLFQGQAQNKTVDFERFMKVKEAYDPYGVFSNPWTDGLLGIEGKRVEMVKKGCGIEKMCKCSRDSHCSPQQGYFCKPGRVWNEARVCRRE